MVVAALALVVGACSGNVDESSPGTVGGALASAEPVCHPLKTSQGDEAGQVCAEVVDSAIRVTYYAADGKRLNNGRLWVLGPGEALPADPGDNRRHQWNGTGTDSYSYTWPNLSVACGVEYLIVANATVAPAAGDSWAGDRVLWPQSGQSGRGWYFGLTVPCPEGEVEYRCESAWARETTDTGAPDTHLAACFREIRGEVNLSSNNWGWSNGPYGATTRTFELIAGAGGGGNSGECLGGTYVGTATVDFDTAAQTATATVTMEEGSRINGAHLYVGTYPVAKDKKGKSTVAPGQFPAKAEGEGETLALTQQGIPASDALYVLLHADVCYPVESTENEETPDPQ